MPSCNSLTWYSNWYTPIIQSACLIKIYLWKTKLFMYILWLAVLLVDCVTVQSMLLTTINKQYMNVAES